MRGNNSSNTRGNEWAPAATRAARAKLRVGGKLSSPDVFFRIRAEVGLALLRRTPTVRCTTL